MATALACPGISSIALSFILCAEARRADIDLTEDLAYKLDVSSSPECLFVTLSCKRERLAHWRWLMKKEERNVRLKAWAIALGLTLTLSILPGAARLLESSAALAAQNNSNRASPRTRRPKKVGSNSNVDQATGGQTTPAASLQNANSQSSNSSGRQARPPYRVEAPKSDVQLEKVMTMDGKELTPDVIEPIGAEITYTTLFKNQGNAPSRSLHVIDPVQDRTDFKIGSVVNNLGTTGLEVTVTYSKDGGETCDYTPVSGAGGAPDGFDRLVNAVCWHFSGDLGYTAPNNAGSLSYVGRRR